LDRSVVAETDFRHVACLENHNSIKVITAFFMFAIPLKKRVASLRHCSKKRTREGEGEISGRGAKRRNWIFPEACIRTERKREK